MPQNYGFPRLTKLEAEILDHRLAVDDALFEVLRDSFPERNYTEDAVYGACRLLLDRNVYTAVVSYGKPLIDEVLADAVEGSTYLGASSCESDQKQNAIFRAGERLAEKIGGWVGRRIYFPDH